MFQIVLYQPQIAPNTGNIIRLCANGNFSLSLIRPYGFSLSEKNFKRAGLDYHNLTKINQYDDFDSWYIQNKNKTIYYTSSMANNKYTKYTYKENNCFIFGNETSGLPQIIKEKFRGITIPMAKNSRCLNLANSVAIIAYEAWRQNNFKLI